jgi:ribosome-associated translation inhibitor RaiA
MQIPVDHTHGHIGVSITPRIQVKGFAAGAGLRRWVHTQLQDLQSLTIVTAVDVTLVRQHGCSPPFQVAVHLAIAGPDIHATARDHTIEAAWLKVIHNTQRQIERRNAKQAKRHKNMRLVRNPISQWSGTGAGQRR